jgi:4-hydroxybutyrate dehydrogenase
MGANAGQWRVAGRLLAGRFEMSLINYLTKIHFADHVLEEALAAEVEALGLRRPMIVTDGGVAASGLVERLTAGLPAWLDYIVFAATPGRPEVSACCTAAETYVAHGCDGLIGFGGGSPIDLAKAIALRATHDGPLCQFAAHEGGTTRIRDVLPPIIAIPTTAGTGSEVVGAAEIIPDEGPAFVLRSPFLVPRVAICDPTLTLDLPAPLTAGTGMDALTHCIETYVSTAYNPPADGIALDGLCRVTANIERAVADGSDLDARREMMAAALNGALALQKGLGGVHAISNALGALSGYDLHHGTLNAVLLPHVLEFNAPAVGDRYAAMKASARMAADADLADGLYRLGGRLGLPSRLGEMGVDAGAIARAASLAERDHANRTNPRRAHAGDYLRIMQAAL